MKLYSYWRSSSAYRVRIALALKGADVEIVPVNLVRDGGEQHRDDYRALNPRGLVPLLVDGSLQLNQSLAILDYLDARMPTPPLLPKAPDDRARVWSLCAEIACDIQPLQNLRVLQHLDDQFGCGSDGKARWAAHWIDQGFAALEARAQRTAGRYLFGDAISAADCCLVPQVYNARRWGVDLSRFPTLMAIDARLADHPAVLAAHPDRQPDAQ